MKVSLFTSMWSNFIMLLARYLDPITQVIAEDNLLTVVAIVYSDFGSGSAECSMLHLSTAGRGGVCYSLRQMSLSLPSLEQSHEPRTLYIADSRPRGMDGPTIHSACEAAKLYSPPQVAVGLTKPTECTRRPLKRVCPIRFCVAIFIRRLLSTFLDPSIIEIIFHISRFRWAQGECCQMWRLARLQVCRVCRVHGIKSHKPSTINTPASRWNTYRLRQRIQYPVQDFLLLLKEAIDLLRERRQDSYLLGEGS